MPPPNTYTAGVQIDHYQIIRLLGQGIANRVYLANDLTNQQEVILKFPRDEIIGGAAIFSAYRREKEIGERLNHPGLQTLLHPGEAHHGEYLVLEYIPGRPLRSLLREQETSNLLPPEHLLRLLLPVCDTLCYVHSQGIIHRDIKPENILVGEDGNVALLDFGIAIFKSTPPPRRLWQSWLPQADMIGTPAYMSPERLQGEMGDERCDIYALGIILYETLCGRTPFVDPDGFSLTNEQMVYDPPDILQFNPGLSPVLATIVMRAIRRDLEKRYPSVGDLAKDLRSIDQVVSRKYVPDSPLLGGRYRQVVAVTALIFIICIALIAFGFLAQSIHHITY